MPGSAFWNPTWGNVMAKEQLHGLEAERLYTIEQCTLAEIAGRLDVSARTLQAWKAKGDWDAKRRAYLASRRSFHEELYEFGRDLLSNIRDDLKEGREPSTGKLYTLGRLLGSLLKVKDYEDVTAKKEDVSKGLTPDIIRLIEKEIGLTGNDGESQ